MPPYILTLDIGSSSVRAILFDTDARPVSGCIAQVGHNMSTSEEGSASFDPNKLLDGAINVIDQVLAAAGPRANEIAGVTTATFVSNILGVDQHGEPTTPIYTYADTRNVQAATELRSRLGPNGIRTAHDRTGCLIHTSYLPARFRWLQQSHPHLLEKTTHWLSIGEYILWKFLGQRVAGFSVASWTGLLDRRTLEWDAEWLDQLPINVEQLSPLVDIDQPLTGLLPEWGKRWPSLASAPWYPAVGDGAAANVGSGAGMVQPDPAGVQQIALTIGTTGAMRMVVDADGVEDLATPDGLWLYRVDRQRGLLGGATTEGGNVYAWARRTLQLPDSEAIESALSNNIPASHGLTVLPFIAGERAPGWDDDARASIIGFSLDTDPLELLQASIEGVCYRFALIYQRIAESQPPDTQFQIMAGGGAILQSPAWLQLMADVLNHPVHALQEHEVTARGLAIIGLEQLGIVQKTEHPVPLLGTTYHPDPQRHEIHKAAITRQVEMYVRLKKNQDL